MRVTDIEHREKRAVRGEALRDQQLVAPLSSGVQRLAAPEAQSVNVNTDHSHILIFQSDHK